MKTYGKLSENLLRKCIFPYFGVRYSDVIESAGIGVDFAVIKCSNKFMIVSADPITGVQKNIGWYAINVNANDVATSGNRPKFVVNVMLLSEYSDKRSIKMIAKEIDHVCKSLNIMVVGGHSEVVKGLKNTILIVTAFTFADKYVTSKNALDGDVIMMTKTAGLEGTSILAREYKRYLSNLEPNVIICAENMIREISVVRDAEIAFSTGYVHAMHDPTEGGVLGGLYEMSVASGLGFDVDIKLIPVAEETKKICRILNVDPLKLISSGVLLMAVDPKGEAYVREELEKNGIKVSKIGYFRNGERTILGKRKSFVIKKSPVDELWLLKKRFS
ncbi:MAG: AIR synthase family protein [Nitrososphaeria archaeon]|nr:AIR synthase family protein [Nitrososphaeria archaeon]